MPPTQRPKTRPRFFVPKGTLSMVANVTRLTRRQCRAVKDVGFEKFESWRAGTYEFRSDGGWLMRVQRRFVVHRSKQALLFRGNV